MRNSFTTFSNVNFTGTSPEVQISCKVTDPAKWPPPIPWATSHHRALGHLSEIQRERLPQLGTFRFWVLSSLRTNPQVLSPGLTTDLVTPLVSFPKGLSQIVKEMILFWHLQLGRGSPPSVSSTPIASKKLKRRMLQRPHRLTSFCRIRLHPRDKWQNIHILKLPWHPMSPTPQLWMLIPEMHFLLLSCHKPVKCYTSTRLLHLGSLLPNFSTRNRGADILYWLIFIVFFFFFFFYIILKFIFIEGFFWLCYSFFKCI